MKFTLYIFLASGLLISCTNKESKFFKVDGTIKNTNAKMVYLEEVPFTGGSPIILDSFQLKNDGNFELESSVKEEGLFSLRTEQKTFPFAIVINDVDKVSVNADLNNQVEPYTVKGSAASEAIIEFDKNLSNRAISLFQVGSRMDSLSKSKAPDSITNAQYKIVESAVAELKQYATDFINKSNHPILIMYALGSYENMANNIGMKGFTETEMAQIINNSLAKFPNSQALENAKKQLRPSKAADITLPDVNGAPVSLSSFRGKYVLVDFWASWCQPCRIENPNIVKAYNQFKDKNFTILGVSLDQKKDAWLDAIKKDGLTWTHISDLKFWESKAVETYRFNSIPYNFLLDPEGNIVAEDLHGDELVITLQQVLK